MIGFIHWVPTLPARSDPTAVFYLIPITIPKGNSHTPPLDVRKLTDTGFRNETGGLGRDRTGV